MPDRISLGASSTKPLLPPLRGPGPAMAASAARTGGAIGVGVCWIDGGFHVAPRDAAQYGRSWLAIGDIGAPVCGDRGGGGSRENLGTGATLARRRRSSNNRFSTRSTLATGAAPHRCRCTPSSSSTSADSSERACATSAAVTAATAARPSAVPFASGLGDSTSHVTPPSASEAAAPPAAPPPAASPAVLPSAMIAATRADRFLRRFARVDGGYSDDSPQPEACDRSAQYLYASQSTPHRQRLPMTAPCARGCAEMT